MRPQATDDTELIRRCLSNDQTAYRLLLEKYSRPVYSIVWRMVRDEEDARDLAQETFVKAFRSLGTFEVGRSF